MQGVRVGAVLLVVPLVAMGCSDDEDMHATSNGGTGGTATTGGHGGTGGDGGHTGTDTLSVAVQQWNGEAIQGAGVALDLAGGARLEVASDAEGQAVFANFDLASLVSVIGHKDGWTYAAATADYVGEHVDVANEPLVLHLDELDPTFITVSGTPINMVDENHSLGVYPTTPVDIHYQAVSNEWSVSVPPNTPFTLVGLEWMSNNPPSQQSDQTFYAWTLVDSPGLGADGTMLLDFGSTVPSSTVSGSFAKPVDETLAEEGQGYMTVATYDHGRGAFVGACTLLQPSSDDTSYDCDAEWIEPPGHALVTTYSAQRVTNNTLTESSMVTVDGVPAGGSQDVGFHSPPLDPVVTSLHLPVTWTRASGETYEFQFLAIYVSGKLEGELRVGATVSEATMPALPSSSDPTQLLPGYKVMAIGNCTGPRHREVCEKRSFIAQYLSPADGG